MSLGKTPSLENLYPGVAEFCEERLSEVSIFRFLHREAPRLFADEAFADLFDSVGRRSIPPRIVAVVMVLQRIEGLSDREAVDRFAFDLRWKYAAGGLDAEFPSFVHTVLVDMRARLRASERPDRIFESVLDVARSAGLVGKKRVLDSTALYDAVATQDTITMIRAAIRGVLRVADASLEAELRAVLKRDDDYASAGKPVCDWDDKPAREALVDELACDGHAVLVALDGRVLPADVTAAGELLASVLGQDLDKGDDGRFRIARRVAPDRIISTVDTESRHGHKTAARGFDGYKGHIAIDPDSEIITAVEVTAGNVGDAVPAEVLLADVLPPVPASVANDSAEAGASKCAADAEPSVETAQPEEPTAVYGDASAVEVTAGNVGDAVPAEVLLADVLPPMPASVANVSAEAGASKCAADAEPPAETAQPEEPTAVYGDVSAVEVTAGHVGDAVPAEVLPADVLPPAPASVANDSAEAGTSECAAEAEQPVESTQPDERIVVYGDASYGTADLVERLEDAGIEANVKVQPPAAREGMYSQEAFKIDREAGTVICPAGKQVELRTRADGSSHASFGDACASCPLKPQCTKSESGRTINAHAKHETLTKARERQRSDEWKQDYRATRPKVERKIGHLMRRKHGGRRSRMRGRVRIRQDFMLLAAAVNLQRLAVLGAVNTAGK